MPNTPVKAAGIRTEPAPSEPWCRVPKPQAAATAAPPELPPGVRSVFQGLRVMPVSGESVRPFQPNSGVVVRPMKTAPASRSATTGELSSVDGAGSMAREPRWFAQPRTGDRPLIVVGTPSIGESGRPSAWRRSDSRAMASAPSSSTRVKALRRASWRRMRAIAARAASTGESRRAAKAAPSASAVISHGSLKGSPRGLAGNSSAS